MDTAFENGFALNQGSILKKVDSTPTTDSTNLVSSGGVKTYVDQKDAATNERIDTVNTQLAASFFFKGSSTYAALPVSGNTINDTYYVTDNDKQCWYSWDGTAWVQSSMSQADYAGLIAQLKADMSSEFSTQKTYNVGDFCLYGADGKLYVCKTAITTTGAAWDSTKWNEVAFADAISDLILATDTQPTSTANKIWLDTDEVPNTVEVVTVEDLANIVAPEFATASAYSTGDYVMHNAELYRAKQNSAANDGWIAARWQKITVMGEMTDELTNVKSAIDEITEDVSTAPNIFDPQYIVSEAGWTKDGDEYYGTALSLKNAFNTSPYYPVSCDADKRYTFSFKAKTANAGGYSGVGLAFGFVYGDGATNSVNCPNSTSNYTQFTLVSSDSTAAHGGVVGILVGYSSGGSNVWYLTDLRLNVGTEISEDALSAIDLTARAENDSINSEIDAIEKDVDNLKTPDNIRMPVINFQFDDGVTEDRDIVDIFDDYTFKCGFAVPSNTEDLTPYVTYQGKGYEIISHSTDGTGMNDATVDLSVIEAKLKSSKETLETAGLKVKGFVTPNSVMNNKFKPLLRKYYDWAVTVSFGTYGGVINAGLLPYTEPVDGVYNVWRVNLQTTTLANAKLAVDKCIENYGCLTFYGHANTLDTNNYLTTENLTALLDYIATKISNGKCVCDIPSKAILNYFDVRNDDVSNAWVVIQPSDVNLDSRLSALGWDMRYNLKTKMFVFSARLQATEAISGGFNVCDLPVHLVSNSYGCILLNESNSNMMFYNNKLISYTSTWASGTSYRLNGFGVFDYIL